MLSAARPVIVVVGIYDPHFRYIHVFFVFSFVLVFYPLYTILSENMFVFLYNYEEILFR